MRVDFVFVLLAAAALVFEVEREDSRIEREVVVSCLAEASDRGFLVCEGDSELAADSLFLVMLV